MQSCAIVELRRGRRLSRASFSALRNVQLHGRQHVDGGCCAQRLHCHAQLPIVGPSDSKVMSWRSSASRTARSHRSSTTSPSRRHDRASRGRLADTFSGRGPSNRSVLLMRAAPASRRSGHDPVSERPAPNPCPSRCCSPPGPGGRLFRTSCSSSRGRSPILRSPWR